MVTDLSQLKVRCDEARAHLTFFRFSDAHKDTWAQLEKKRIKQQSRACVVIAIM